MFRAARSPWWFCSDGSGRFDLPFSRGTCYLATEPLGALLEVARGLTLLPEAFLDRRRLLTTSFPADLRLAELTAAAAYQYGITGEIAAAIDYTASRAWAHALDTAGFDGIRYHIRHDPRAQLIGIAHFGRAGRLRHPPASTRQPIPTDVLAAAAPFGITAATALPPETDERP